MENIAVIGTGSRASGVIANLLRDSGGQVKIVAVYDPDTALARKTLKLWHSPEAAVCASMEEAIRRDDVEWVMVFSPNAFHRAAIECAFAEGKHVFSEKPLATTIEDCQAIYDAHVRSGLLFMTGFVLRYAPLYRKAKEILDSGALGKILSINADENIDPAHGGYIMTGWRRHCAVSGPHLLEKCCHDLDLLNWFCQSLPSKVAAFGGLDFFTPTNEGLFHEMPPDTFTKWPNPHRTAENAFAVAKDILDTQVCILRYRNGVKVQFQATMSNAIPERRMYFSCTRGTLILELYTGELRCKKIGDTEETRLILDGGGHGGGDDYIMKELFETMQTGMPPRASGNEGLESAVCAIALDTAMRDETILDLEPIWARLGR